MSEEHIRPPTDVVGYSKASKVPSKGEYATYVASPHIILNYRFDSATPPQVRHATLVGKKFSILDQPDRGDSIPPKNAEFLKKEKARVEAFAEEQTSDFKELVKAQPKYQQGVMVILVAAFAFTLYFLYAV